MIESKGFDPITLLSDPTESVTMFAISPVSSIAKPVSAGPTLNALYESPQDPHGWP